MSSRKMWFGNKNYMQWVECPQAGADYGANPSAQSAQYLNGGAFRRQTLSAARTYNLSWTLTSRENIRKVTDYAEGVYGEGPIYWADPFNMDANMLAQSFATPSLGAYDGRILTGDARPSLVPTSANSLGYPTESAVYTVAGDSTSFRHWIPIPPGYTAWVGVHGSAGSGGLVRIKTTNRGVSGATNHTATLLSVTSDTRVTNSYNASASVDGIEIYLAGTGTITLSGIIVQVLPTGRVPQKGGFISGQGHSGCSWDGMPAKNAYSAAMDLVGLSASFIETEQWR